MKNAERIALFIDRDGTMGENCHVEFPWDFHPFDDIGQTVSRLKAAGFLVFAFTNQSCIARGKSEGYNFDAEFREYGLDDWFICPHDSRDNCDCRKPKSGLLLTAKEKHDLDLSKCYVIGDRLSDLEAGANVGSKTILVLTGFGNEALKQELEKWKGIEPEFVARNLKDAADRLIQKHGRGR